LIGPPLSPSKDGLSQRAAIQTPTSPKTANPAIATINGDFAAALRDMPSALPVDIPEDGTMGHGDSQRVL
jgi:hypothetical protein